MQVPGKLKRSFLLNCLLKLLFFIVQFGESQKLRLVRILRSTVMVRVGGGWVSLNEFLHKHDPCRCKCLEDEECYVLLI